MSILSKKQFNFTYKKISYKDVLNEIYFLLYILNLIFRTNRHNF
jgi:hypothetical protein